MEGSCALPQGSRGDTWKVADRGTHTNMNFHRLGNLALVGIGTFVVIAIAAWLFIRLIAPTITPARMVAFDGVMSAVTGSVIAIVAWAAKGDR